MTNKPMKRCSISLIIQFSSVAQSCPTLCDPVNRSTPGLPVHHQLPEFTQTHVHWVHDAIQPSISSSVIPFSSCPKSLPTSESFPMSQLFAWGGQSTGVSPLASFLPKKSQGWSPSEWTGWISLQCKGFSRVFSNTTDILVFLLMCTHFLYMDLRKKLFIWLCQVLITSHEIYCCGTWTLQLCCVGLRCSEENGLLVPWSGIELVVSALQAGFLNPGPPGKSPLSEFKKTSFRIVNSYLL